MNKLQALKELFQKAFETKRTHKYIYSVLENCNDIYIKDYSESYFNIRIYAKTGNKLSREYIRIYEYRKGYYKAQLWTPCEMKYSGIPTFFATGL